MDRPVSPAGNEIDDVSFDDFDEIINPKPQENDFDAVVERALSRRDFLGGVLAFGSVAALGSITTALTPLSAQAAMERFGFEAVEANTLDTITVPQGYKWQVAAKWGDPLFADVPDFDDATRGTPQSQSRAFGDNNDGMALFVDGDRSVLVVNNEYTNRSIIWGNREDGKAADAADIEKGMMAHGVTIAQIRESGGSWEIVKDSPVNRRITPQTAMDITGPARGHELVKTADDPSGTVAKGTWNNCGNGSTPWGTYLACEENFNGYFSSSDDNFEIPADFKRYGIGAKDWGYGWAKIDDRFDISKHPNEPHRAGYVVEIDPYDPTATPRKLTALGRFKHENAEIVVNPDGRIVVYMGDDERGEFLYKFVSDGVYAEGGSTDRLLEEGTLYAATFADNGTGKWMALSEETTDMTRPDICIHTRMAASRVGATTMDRPEWVAANPLKAEIYCALTNNKNRGKKPNAGNDATPVGGPNPRAGNKYGQIVRWRPFKGDHTATDFSWDLFVLAGNPTLHTDAYGGSSNIHAGNMFNSPDGIFFDTKGLLWIQTDGNYSNEKDFAGMGNNQMLVGDPASGEIRRFMVGPKECEVTGSAFSADRRTLFIGIQHPGDRGNGHWPLGGNKVPRSGVVAVSREDGAVIG